MPNELQKLPREVELLSKAADFLEQCRSLDEVKDLRDKAEAARLYYRKVSDSRRAANVLAEVRIKAERRLGELVAEMPKDKGGRPGGNGNRSHDVTGLADLGIGKMESSRVQAIAAVPKREFEEVITKAKEANRELTSREMVVRGQRHQRRHRKTAELRERAAATPAPSTPTWEVIQGDCVEVLNSLPAGSSRLIFADPPYNIGIDYGDHYDDEQPRDAYLAWCRQWIEAAVRVLTPDGSMWVLINDQWAAEFKIMLEAAGLHLRRWIIWYETFGQNHTRNFTSDHRHLLYMVRAPKNFVFIEDAPEIRRRSDRQAKYHDSRANPDGRLWGSVWGIDPPIPRLPGTCDERVPGFPTQLPLDLLRPIIACASKRGDLVIDSHAGSSTTGVAALELGRRYLGIELSEEAVKLSRQRLKGVVPTKAAR
jgi:site-specific DNA-methyltransferase (adenine-specific)